LLRDKRAILVEKMKNVVIRTVHHQEKPDLSHTFSHLIAEALQMDYSYLSALFSASEGTTLEKYVIRQKIERVKELLAYDELTLSEIAVQIGYHSVAHLSAQFKKMTGLTPSEFKRVNERKRTPLDEI
jgi:AraC family transcriptional regulator